MNGSGAGAWLRACASDRHLCQSLNVNQPTNGRDDLAASLTSSLGLWLHRIALVVFPIGTVICLLVLALGDPNDPSRLGFTTTLSALATFFAVRTELRHRKVDRQSHLP